QGPLGGGVALVHEEGDVGHQQHIGDHVGDQEDVEGGNQPEHEGAEHGDDQSGQHVPAAAHGAAAGGGGGAGRAGGDGSHRTGQAAPVGAGGPGAAPNGAVHGDERRGGVGPVPVLATRGAAAATEAGTMGAGAAQHGELALEVVDRVAGAPLGAGAQSGGNENCGPYAREDQKNQRHAPRTFLYLDGRYCAPTRESRMVGSVWRPLFLPAEG